jgi:predicted permease
VLLLGLGVGSVSAIFAIVDHVLLRALPYPESDRLVLVQNGSHSGPAYEDFQELRSVEFWSAISTEPVNVTGDGAPARALEARVSERFFEMFGARPALGRLLAVEDAGVTDRIVLSHGAWLRFFGGEPSAIGRETRVNGDPVQIVGVLGERFHPPEGMMSPDVDFYRSLDFTTADLQRRNHQSLRVVGRLAAGATLADLQDEADRLADSRARLFPDNYVDREGRVRDIPMISLQEGTVDRVRQGLGLLFGAVTLLLLVACANVTHLFLARGVERTREMSLRRALGAGNGTLLSQLFVESFLLGLAGALLGIGLAAGGLRAFDVFNPGGLPRVGEIVIDFRITLFAASVAILTAVAFGMVPAVRLANVEAGTVLRSAGRNATGSRGTHAFRNGLVALEVALSLVLIAQAGWLLRSFVRMNQESLGFRTPGIYTVPLRLTGIDSPETWHRNVTALRDALSAVPDVRSATLGLSMPLEFTGGGRCCWYTRWAESSTGSELMAIVHPVDAHYFDVFAIAPVAGRLWTESDDRMEPTPMVITEPFATELFGNAASAVGRQLMRGDREFSVVAVLQANRSCRCHVMFHAEAAEKDRAAISARLRVQRRSAPAT